MIIEENKIYNMDCLDGMRLMKEQGIKVDCVITDPPYNVNLTPQRKKSGVESSRKTILNDNLNEEEFCGFLTQVFKGIYDILSDNSFLITFMGWQTIPQFNRAIQSAGFEIKSMLYGKRKVLELVITRAHNMNLCIYV